MATAVVSGTGAGRKPRSTIVVPRCSGRQALVELDEAGVALDEAGRLLGRGEGVPPVPDLLVARPLAVVTQGGEEGTATDLRPAAQVGQDVGDGPVVGAAGPGELVGREARDVRGQPVVGGAELGDGLVHEVGHVRHNRTADRLFPGEGIRRETFDPGAALVAAR